MAQLECYNANPAGKDEFSASCRLPLALVLVLECGLGMVYVSKVEPIELADGKWLVKEEVYAGVVSLGAGEVGGL